uniref:Uncharacterized protein n=1 Tax=Anguilla anguilla TaxID=7936 RepID=A0A0E9PFY8_ANGAN
MYSSLHSSAALYALFNNLLSERHGKQKGVPGNFYY